MKKKWVILIMICLAIAIVCLYFLLRNEDAIDYEAETIALIEKYAFELSDHDLEAITIYSDGEDDVIGKKVYRVKDDAKDYIILYSFSNAELNRKVSEKINPDFQSQKEDEIYSIMPVVYKNMTLVYLDSNLGKEKLNQIFQNLEKEIIFEICNGEQCRFSGKGEAWSGYVDEIWFEETVHGQQFYHTNSYPYMQYEGDEAHDSVFVSKVSLYKEGEWEYHLSSEPGNFVHTDTQLYCFPSSRSNARPKLEQNYILEVEWNGKTEKIELTLETEN